MKQRPSERDIRLGAEAFERELGAWQVKRRRKAVRELEQLRKPMAPSDVRQVVKSLGGRARFAGIMAESERTVARWEVEGITGDLATGVRIAAVDIARTRELASEQRNAVISAVREGLRDRLIFPGHERREGIASYRRIGRMYHMAWAATIDTIQDVWSWAKRKRGQYPFWQLSVMVAVWGGDEDALDGRRWYGIMLEDASVDWQVLTEVPLNSTRHRSIEPCIKDVERELRELGGEVVIESAKLTNFRVATKREQDEWFTRKEREKRRRHRAKIG